MARGGPGGMALPYKGQRGKAVREGALHRIQAIEKFRPFRDLIVSA